MTRGTGGYFWWISVLFFMTTGLGPMWLFTLNLGFRGTLSWARIRPGETRIFRLSADWSERELRLRRWDESLSVIEDLKFPPVGWSHHSPGYFMKTSIFWSHEEEIEGFKSWSSWQMRHHHKLRFTRTKLSQHFYHPRRSILWIFSISLFEVEYSFQSSKLKIQKFQLKVK